MTRFSVLLSSLVQVLCQASNGNPVLGIQSGKVLTNLATQISSGLNTIGNTCTGDRALLFMHSFIILLLLQLSGSDCSQIF